MDLSKDLVAASATPLILAILRQQDSYGYEIIKTIREASSDEIVWTEGMLYPVLHRLEKNGLVESYWKTSQEGRRRKYYRLMPVGRDQAGKPCQTMGPCVFGFSFSYQRCQKGKGRCGCLIWSSMSSLGAIICARKAW